MPNGRRRIWMDLLALASFVPFVVLGAEALPFGSHPHAIFLDGADAGEWALNAQHVLAGRLDRVDTHRGPLFVLLIALARLFTHDIAHAGHTVVVGAWVARPFVLYAAGRVVGGPLVGWLAGLLVLGCTPLYFGAAQYGVDPVLSTMLPCALAVVGPARRHPVLAWVAGMVVCIIATSHLSALPYAIPAAALLWVRGDSRHHKTSVWARPLLFLSGLVATLLVLQLMFDMLTLHEVAHSLSEGIAPDGGGAGSALAFTPEAEDVLRHGSSAALVNGSHTLLSPFLPFLSPWLLLVGLLWLGVVGPGLARPSSGPPGWLRHRLGRRPELRWQAWQADGHPLARFVSRYRSFGIDLFVGLVVLSTLAPAPLFAAAQSPERYTYNLLPLAALVLARGLAATPALLFRLGPPRLRMVLSAPLAIAMGVWLIFRVHGTLSIARADVPAPGMVARTALDLARVLDEVTAPQSAVAVPIRESAAHLEREFCPRRSCVPGPAPDAFLACVEQLRVECRGTDPIPYVWLRAGPVGMGDDAFTQSFGAWAVETYPTVGKLQRPGFDAIILEIPRSDTQQ
jgi:hypothetical protein